MNNENLNLTDAQSSKAMKDAILSSCWGAFAQVMIMDSAVIILFATILGAGDMLSIITTSAQGLCDSILMVPAAYFSAKIGYKKTAVCFNIIAIFFVALLAASPFFGTWSKFVLMTSIVLFSMCMTAYAASWFPMIDRFLPREGRSNFFGLMRFSWQTCAVIFFFGCGLWIGKNPEIWMLQVIIVVTALCLLGRVYYISRFPVKSNAGENIKFMASLAETISNKSLCGFSVYICFLYLAAYSTLPLTFIFIKKYLLVPDNVIVIISSLALTGSIIGFLFAGRIIGRYGIKKLLLIIHLFFAVVNFSLFFMGSASLFSLIMITLLLMTYSFFFACSGVAISTEMIELASPDNKAISIAFFGSCFAAGMGGSRFLTSLILGSGMLAPEWTLGSLKISHYQTLFLVYGFAIIFVCLLLVLVPAIFPKGTYRYMQ